MTKPRKYCYLNRQLEDDYEITENDFPIIKPHTGKLPEHVTRFGDRQYDGMCVFFTNDFRFERVWGKANKYVLELKKYTEGVCGPDFSMYPGQEMPLNYFNKYRNHRLTVLWQNNGINVIPNVRWTTSMPSDLWFDGYPKNSNLAVSSVSSLTTPETKTRLINGVELMMDILKPKKILWYGILPQELFEYDNIYVYRSRHEEIFK